jgi:FK506-binding protein 2
MCVGEKRTLTIPSHMAYGLFSICRFIFTLSIDARNTAERGFGSVIPANSALVFDVELVDLTRKSSHEEL